MLALEISLFILRLNKKDGKHCYRFRESVLKITVKAGESILSVVEDPEWFENQIDILKVNKLLNKFLNSDLFKNIMFKYEVWKTDSKAVFFPMS